MISALFVRAWILVVAVSAVPCAARGQEAPKPDPPPPVAAGEEAAKPDRGFFGTLFHNLGDDVKHIPRKNSLYWLAAGSGLAAAIHPADDDINRRLQGSGAADGLFKPGKFLGSSYTIGAASVAMYFIARHGGHGRAKHLGMDLLESTLLSEGITQVIKVAVRRDRPIAGREDARAHAGSGRGVVRKRWRARPVPHRLISRCFAQAARCSGKQIVANDRVDRAETVTPAYLFTFRIGAAAVRNSDLINAAAHFRELRRDLDFDRETVFAQLEFSRDLGPERLGASFDIAQVQICQCVGKQSEQFVADEVPEIENATRPVADET